MGTSDNSIALGEALDSFLVLSIPSSSTSEASQFEGVVAEGLAYWEGRSGVPVNDD